MIHFSCQASAATQSNTAEDLVATKTPVSVRSFIFFDFSQTCYSKFLIGWQNIEWVKTDGAHSASHPFEGKNDLDSFFQAGTKLSFADFLS